MLTLEAINSRTHACQRCESHFHVIYPSGRAAQSAILQVRRRGSVVETIKELRQLTGGSLSDAKGTAMHIGTIAGECHWCRKPVPAAEFSDCPHCASLNIHPSA